jgi:SET domain-containing protein
VCDDDLEEEPRSSSQYSFDLGGGCVVDAKAGGNATRRMNHSSSCPTVRATIVNHRGVRKICMRARVDIASNTELTFDYGRGFSKYLK